MVEAETRVLMAGNGSTAACSRCAPFDGLLVGFARERGAG